MPIKYYNKVKREEFFSRLLFGGASLFVFRPAQAKTVNVKSEIRLNSPYIAGFQYYKGCDIEDQLKENDILELKREPVNSHDRYAVEVFRSGEKLGYLPREENKVIARMMDQGIEVKARIVGFNYDTYPYRFVRLKVFCYKD